MILDSDVNSVENLLMNIFNVTHVKDWENSGQACTYVGGFS